MLEEVKKSIQFSAEERIHDATHRVLTFCLFYFDGSHQFKVN